MSEGRQSARKLLLGPRALAVISCALALLAAQPALAAVEKTGERISSVRASTGVGTIETLQPMAVTATRRNRGAVIQQQAKSGAARHVHVLATVEILKRLLTIELQPIGGVEQHVMAAFIFEPVCVLILDTPASPPHRCWVAQRAGISAEGDFAKARLGLAPPRA